MMPQRTTGFLIAATLVAGLASAEAPATSSATGAQVVSAPSTATATQNANESPLVKAARDAAAKRGTKTRLTINDKDVKKSAGKLIETTSRPLPAVPNQAAEIDKRNREVKAAATSEAAAQKSVEDRVGKLAKEVESLESELRRVEESYYDEDDPDFREDVIEKKFNDTKAKLERARQDLEAARAAAAARGVSTP
jgi:HAMP domain-containing protein